MTASEFVRDTRADLDDLEDRSQRLRKDVRKRAEATRDDVLKRTEATREQLAALAAEMGEDVGERAAQARDLLIERYHELEDELPIEEVAAKAEVVATKARLGAWQAFQRGLTALVTVPGLIVRGLGSLSGIADDLADRGADLSERGRELVAAVPPSKAERRRSRVRTAGVASLGFLIGAVVGWVLAGRKQTVVTYEPPLPASWEQQAADPAHSERPGSSPATSQSDILDVRSQAERPEPGRGV